MNGGQVYLDGNHLKPAQMPVPLIATFRRQLERADWTDQPCHMRRRCMSSKPTQDIFHVSAEVASTET
jgi:hypothetical protein